MHLEYDTCEVRRIYTYVVLYPAPQFYIQLIYKPQLRTIMLKAVWAVTAVREKYPTFEDFFFIFSWAKQIKNDFLYNCIVASALKN